MTQVSSSPPRRSRRGVHPVARLPEDWAAFFADRGERAFRAGQVFRWIHQRGELDPANMTDLSKSLREMLVADGLRPPYRLADVRRSVDGTRKLLLELDEGGRVECVLIPMTNDDDEDDDAPDASRKKLTLCISTQLGCAMGCVFCASGQAGLIRGLTAGEIAAQVLEARRHLEPGEALTNLVYMGMGEPLHHYDETARSIRVLSHGDGAGIGLRRITVSTVGLVPGIRRLGEDFHGKVGLALSLHAPNDEIRRTIMPMNEKFGVRELIQTLHDYPLPRRRRITIEYTLIAGVNDRVEDARALSKLLRRLPVKVNLIPMNSIEASEHQAPADERVDAFRDVLVESGYSCFLRKRRGDDVAAACGQLALASQLVRRPAES